MVSKRAIVLFVLLVFLIIGGTRTFLWAEECQQHNYKPKNGYIPNATVAIKIAEAILTPIYGEETINMEKPFNAELVGNIWRVTGTLHCPKGGVCVGGVAIIELLKEEGTVQRVSHGE